MNRNNTKHKFFTDEKTALDIKWGQNDLEPLHTAVGKVNRPKKIVDELKHFPG